VIIVNASRFSVTSKSSKLADRMDRQYCDIYCLRLYFCGVIEAPPPSNIFKTFRHIFSSSLPTTQYKRPVRTGLGPVLAVLRPKTEDQTIGPVLKKSRTMDWTTETLSPPVASVRYLTLSMLFVREKKQIAEAYKLGTPKR
jgi:hypothetical protein